MIYNEWYQLYVRLYKRNLKPKTIESYSRIHTLIQPIIGGIRIEDITPEDIQTALIRVEDLAGSRQAQLAYSLIHAALRRAVRSRHILSNPADAVDRPEHISQQGRAIEGEDWQLLEPIIDEDLAFCLMARAGLRRGEVLALRWCDIDLQQRVIRVRSQLVRAGGKLLIQPTKSRSGARDVPIEPRLLQLLRRCYRLTPNQRVINCAPETLGHRWRRAQLGVSIARPYRLHDLRHTYATRMVRAGCNLRILQYMIGHASYELTVSTYTHIGPAAAAAELDRICESLH